MKKLYITLAALASLLAFSSCDDFLSKLPDSRATLDTEEKLEALLVSAYPTSDYQLVTEEISDNMDDMGEDNPYTSRFYDQLWAWEDITETNNEAPEAIWEAHYYAIANANQVLEAIEDMGGATTLTLQQIQAEALICRAYCHFILLNVFALHYDSSTAASDPGITYMFNTETTLINEYDRNSVAECYEYIKADLEAALPNISDSYMSVPKYHFNPTAAYAFACRFYLYYEMWDEAIEYADKVLGASPKTKLRDYEALGENSTYSAQSQAYIDDAENANLLLVTGYSSMGIVCGPYYAYHRYTHSPLISKEETTAADNPWGGFDSNNLYTLYYQYAATNLSCVIFWRCPALFEYTDEVAGIGYYHCVFPVLTGDETILNRAEAKIMTGDYDGAAEDMNIWVQNFSSITDEATPTSITEFYNSIEYATWDASTPKKHLNPAFDIGAEGETRESMLQAVLYLRRIETLHEGLRWFDVKRYGIEIWRRRLDSSGKASVLLDELSVDDPRRAVQIPLKVRTAGYEANPR